MSIWTRLTLLCIAGLLFVAGAYLVNRDRALRLERELAATRMELENLHIDHRDTMDAITSALDAREAIHEQARFKEEKLRKALENFPHASVPLPDDVRMRLQGERDCEIPAAGNSASGHDNPGPLKNQDGR